MDPHHEAYLHGYATRLKEQIAGAESEINTQQQRINDCPGMSPLMRTKIERIIEASEENISNWRQQLESIEQQLRQLQES